MASVFKVKWLPRAQARHRHTRSGHVYDPSSKDKKDFLKLILNQLPKEPIKEPIAISITWELPYPKKWLRTGKYEGLVKDQAPSVHSSKPDIDNLEKFLFDSLNGKLFVDDCLIWLVTKQKVYSTDPGVTIEVEITNERKCKHVSHRQCGCQDKANRSDY